MAKVEAVPFYRFQLPLPHPWLAACGKTKQHDYVPVLQYILLLAFARYGKFRQFRYVCARVTAIDIGS